MKRKPHYYVVDRFEGKLAVLVGDDRSSHDVPKASLPKGCREDTVLRVPVVSGNPDFGRAVIDVAERERRLARAKAALDQLKRRDPGGDVTL